MKKFTPVIMALAFVFSGQALAITEYNTDLVIVGAGNAGLPAAATAAQMGIDTITLEKGVRVGGQLHVIEGTYAVGTDLQRREMVGLDAKKSFDETMQYGAWRADPSLVKRIVEASGPNIKWLKNSGVKMQGLMTDAPDGNRTYHTYESNYPGLQTCDALMKVIKDNGGKVWTETAGKKLITNDKGEVVGIIAHSEEKGDIKINAKAVLLATGSMSHNAKLMAKFNPNLLVDGKPMKSNAIKNDTGDGVEMGLAVGADVANTDVVISEALVPTNTMYAEMYVDPKMLDAYMILKTQSLWVNTRGQRVMDESHSNDFTIVLNALQRHGNQAYVIMDDAKRVDLMKGNGADTNYFTVYEAGRKIIHFDDVVADGQKRGYAYKANSIKELAKLMKVRPDVLQATVDRYNQLAKAGEDKDFGKTRNLVPLLKAPFYAFKGDNTICDMTGGLLINKNAQVMSKKGYPIKGLYAAGSMAGGMYGHEYPYINPGFASATAIATGRFAVQDVAQKLESKK